MPNCNVPNYYVNLSLSLDAFLNYLLDYSGVIKGFVNGTSPCLSFFTPYHSKKEFLFKSLSIVSAPLAMAIATLACAFIAALIAIIALGDGLCGHCDHFEEGRTIATATLIMGFFALLTVVLSPFLNLVSVIGSGCATFMRPEDVPGADIEMANQLV